jgi:hypothetical protein|tara:strand:+ start:326 stop:835 length:510 start_codon:yes stop_codon:yes gene_type:complete
VANKRKKKAKTKRRRRNAKKRIGRTVQSQWGKISKGAGVLAALSQITGTDMSASAGQPIGSRAQNFVNSLSGRITGYTPFKSAAGASIPQTISIDGMFNKWSGIGLGTLIYSMVPIKMLPHRGKAKTLGKSLLTGGILGGLFSVGNPHNTNLISPSRALTVSSSEVSYT